MFDKTRTALTVLTLDLISHDRKRSRRGSTMVENVITIALFGTFAFWALKQIMDTGNDSFLGGLVADLGTLIGGFLSL